MALFLCTQVGPDVQHVLAYKLDEQYLLRRHWLLALAFSCPCVGMWRRDIRIVYEVRAIASLAPPLSYDIIT